MLRTQPLVATCTTSPIRTESCGTFSTIIFFVCQNCSLIFSLAATVDNGRMGRLLNHSRTAPNVVTRLVEVAEKPYLCLLAARDILIGEELQYDSGEKDRLAIDSNPWLKN